LLQHTNKSRYLLSTTIENQAKKHATNFTAYKGMEGAGAEAFLGMERDRLCRVGSKGGNLLFIHPIIHNIANASHKRDDALPGIHL